MQPLHDFYVEFNKDGKQELEILVVNCDQTESEQFEHLKELEWAHHVPFSAVKVHEKLEDMGQVETIPKLSIINTQKGFA